MPKQVGQTGVKVDIDLLLIKRVSSLLASQAVHAGQPATHQRRTEHQTTFQRMIPAESNDWDRQDPSSEDAGEDLAISLTATGQRGAEGDVGYTRATNQPLVGWQAKEGALTLIS